MNRPTLALSLSVFRSVKFLEQEYPPVINRIPTAYPPTETGDRCRCHVLGEVFQAAFGSGWAMRWSSGKPRWCNAFT
jgi:hypothetical protein